MSLTSDPSPAQQANAKADKFICIRCGELTENCKGHSEAELHEPPIVFYQWVREQLRSIDRKLDRLLDESPVLMGFGGDANTPRQSILVQRHTYACPDGITGPLPIETVTSGAPEAAFRQPPPPNNGKARLAKVTQYLEHYDSPQPDDLQWLLKIASAAVSLSDACLYSRPALALEEIALRNVVNDK